MASSLVICRPEVTKTCVYSTYWIGSCLLICCFEAKHMPDGALYIIMYSLKQRRLVKHDASRCITAQSKMAPEIGILIMKSFATFTRNTHSVEFASYLRMPHNMLSN